VVLIDKGHGADSNLVRALKGESLKVSDGKGGFTLVSIDKGMPPPGKGATMPPEDIARIERWIDAGVPETLPGK
jgi:hypothetical protein